MTQTKKKRTAKSKKNPCWPGYEPVPGKKPFTKGSCAPVKKKASSKKKKTKT